MPELATRLVIANFPGFPNGGSVPPDSKLIFTLSAPVYNLSNGKAENMTVVGPINPTNGDMGNWDTVGTPQAGARLIANDDANITPTGTFWRVHFAIPGQTWPDLAIVVSTGNTDPVRLTALAQPAGGSLTYGLIDITSADHSATITTPSPGVRDISVVGGGGGGAPPSTVTPLTDVAGGAVGTATPYTREDHRHPLSSAYATAAALTAEASTARAAESANASAITSEASTARAAESANATAITNEASTARAAEALKLAKASNLSDLASAATARTNLGLGGAAVLNVGTTAGTVAAGDDSRFSGGGASFPLQSPFPGGNARGAGATDLQTAHSANNMVASGTDATIGGGQDNIASGNWSVVAGGRTNTAGGRDASILGGIGNTTSGNEPTIAGGNGNTASGDNSFVGGGQVNTASGFNSSIPGGIGNIANGLSSSVPGGNGNTASGDYSRAAGFRAVASLYGQDAYAAWRFSVSGDAQKSDLVAGNSTTDATPTELFLDGPAATQRLTLAQNRASAYRMLVIARQDTGAAVAAWEATGIMNRVTGGNIALSGNSVTALGTPPAGWAFAVSADTTNQSLKMQGTGAAATNVHWVSRVMLTEVI